jgi:hypothetical protein
LSHEHHRQNLLHCPQLQRHLIAVALLPLLAAAALA